MAHEIQRVFEVTNPRKSYAGPTVYRISCKVIKRGIQPELIDELVVWRRFSEFKRLHKDLSKIYNKQAPSKTFPSLAKATFFDRFDDSVIEERRLNILNLLTFISNLPLLAEHEYLDKFMGGGMYTSGIASAGSSRTSSFSGSEGDFNELHTNVRVSPPESTRDQEQSNISNEDSTQGCLELGGVWLHKQPSLVEGLDTAGNEETVPDRTPTFIQRSLSFEDEQDNVFSAKLDENESSSSEDEEGERTTGWLQRAISLCSEGEDIETLASEGERSEFIDELNFPKPFADSDNDDAPRSELDSSRSSQEYSNDNSSAKNEDPNSNIDSTNSTSIRSVAENEESRNNYSRIANESEPCRFLPQQPSFDCSGDVDYLVVAANIVRDAIACELEGQYKESFHLYKKCVSLLLHGVQEEKDSKRRDAVRRKTAQYLLKAEALYTAYIHETNKTSSESVQPRLPSSSPEEEQNELDMSKHLNLRDFAVIGVIGKVILVENKTDKSNYVMKVLSKTEGHHSRHKSRRSKRKKHFIKAAYSKCPFIVELHQHCETQTAVFLILEHARGGMVWDHLLPVLHRRDYNKSQSYVHNLKETELNKTRPCNVVIKQNTQLSHEIKIGKTNKGSLKSSLNTKSKEDGGAQLLNENNEDNVKKERLSVFALLDAKSKEGGFSLEACVRLWMAEIVVAVSHLHRHGVICRDLNPKNILLSESGHVLLSHFSTWMDVNDEPDLFSLEMNYCAPELFKLDPITMTADWWSVGALFYEMLMGESLSSQYPWGVRQHTQIELQDYVSREAASLIKELLVVTPSERLGHGVNGVDNIQSHPFFADIDWTTLT